MNERDKLAERIAKIICFDKAWDYMICRRIADFILKARPKDRYRVEDSTSYSEGFDDGVEQYMNNMTGESE